MTAARNSVTIETVSNEIAGRLFYSAWKNITRDRFILQIIRGYKIPFVKKSKQKQEPNLKQAPDQSTLIKEAIDSLLDKSAIVQVKRNKTEFLSSYFLRPKPDNTYRFIINFKKLNKFIHKEHFKLEDLKTATKLVFSGTS